MPDAEAVWFDSAGTRSTGELVRASGEAFPGPDGNRPCVVLGHGASGTVDSGLHMFAEGFARGSARAGLRLPALRCERGRAAAAPLTEHVGGGLRRGRSLRARARRRRSRPDRGLGAVNVRRARGPRGRRRPAHRGRNLAGARDERARIGPARLPAGAPHRHGAPVLAHSEGRMGSPDRAHSRSRTAGGSSRRSLGADQRVRFGRHAGARRADLAQRDPGQVRPRCCGAGTQQTGAPGPVPPPRADSRARRVPPGRADVRRGRAQHRSVRGPQLPDGARGQVFPSRARARRRRPGRLPRPPPGSPREPDRLGPSRWRTCAARHPSGWSRR